MITVKLTDTYDAWQYTGGSELPEEIRNWMEPYHLSYVSLERDQFYLATLVKVREIMDFSFSATQREASEHLEWTIEESTFRCFPGEFIVDTEIGPSPCLFDQIVVVNE